MPISSTQSRSAVPYPLAVGGVLFASVCYGLVPYFSRGLTEQGVAPYAVSFYRYIVGAVLLLPLLFRQRRAWREICWGLSAGAVLGLGWIGYVVALQALPASTVGVIYMTYPVFTLFIAWFLFSDRPSKRAYLAAAMIILAAIIAGSPAIVPLELLPTFFIALAAPFGFGFSISVLVHKLSLITPFARIASVSLGAVAGLLPLMIFADASQTVPGSQAEWILLAGIGLVTALVPQLVYVICTPVVGASRAAILGSIELPTMFAVGFFAFGEAISAPQAISCVLILAAILTMRARKHNSVASSLTKVRKE